MNYKTICLGLLEQRPDLYESLRQSQTLLTTLNQLSSTLKARHQAWKHELQETRPASDQQITSEALELAIQELEGRLSAESENEARDFLDATMASLRPTPTA